MKVRYIKKVFSTLADSQASTPVAMPGGKLLQRTGAEADARPGALYFKTQATTTI
jgi:hypothetical protein